MQPLRDCLEVYEEAAEDHDGQNRQRHDLHHDLLRLERAADQHPHRMRRDAWARVKLDHL